jgi:NADH-quinone oxidoreductase subunit H
VAEIVDSLAFLTRVLVFPGLVFILGLALLYDWVERKLMARMQNRMGPSYAGAAGILQPLADYIKLFSKEVIVPRQASTILHTFSPILAFSIFVASIFFMPIDGLNVMGDPGFEGDLLLVLVLATLAVFMIYLAGWSSANPYSEIGAVRALVQFLGYDIPLMMSASAPAILAGSLSMNTIARSQRIPFAFLVPWVFALFLIVLQAELEEDPFDVPHAETEIVAGYETEFSGGQLAFLKLSRDLQVVYGASLTTVLFLGGPSGPAPVGPAWLWGTFWFVVKSLVIVVIIEAFEASCARLRIDQVLRGNWRLMIPLAALSLVVAVLATPWIRQAQGVA